MVGLTIFLVAITLIFISILFWFISSVEKTAEKNYNMQRESMIKTIKHDYNNDQSMLEEGLSIVDRKYKKEKIIVKICKLIIGVVSVAMLIMVIWIGCNIRIDNGNSNSDYEKNANEANYYEKDGKWYYQGDSPNNDDYYNTHPYDADKAEERKNK